MKKAVILHATDSDATSHWYAWLKAQLEAKAYQVWLPDLPGADRPQLDAYNKFLLSGNWDFQDNVLVGHSSGSKAIMALLQALPEGVTVQTAVLVGTFLGDLGWDELHGVDIPFDYEKIKSKADKFIVIHGADDPYCPVAGAKEVADKLAAEWHLLPTGQHFSQKLDPKYAQFPELLEIINPYL